MNPFRYPKAKHRRQLTPPNYKSYRSYKPFLREEFSCQCVYCRNPDGIKGADSFGIDHYRPKSKFPNLETVYENLFYACNACNRRKGAYWPTNAQMRAGQFLPNPCDYQMFEHLRFKDVRVETRTRAGEWAEKQLMLNDKGSIDLRRFILDTIKVIVEKKRGLLSTLASIRNMARSDPSRTDKLLPKAEKLSENILRLDQHLNRLTGTQ